MDIVKKTIPIVYEDSSICIADKPCGIPVQRGAGIATALIDILSTQLGQNLFLVHRLDKETAGLLLIAKTAEAACECRKLFESRSVKKTYLALCFGSGKAGSEGRITAPILENGKAKPALTEYRLWDSSSDHSTFLVKLHTGRMHQIRIHLAGIGYPLIGDDKHGNFPLNKVLRKDLGIRKLQLCAYQLALPLNGSIHTFKAAIPEHITDAAAKLHIGLPE